MADATYAVIVAYKPDIRKLMANVSGLADQVAHIVIVHNGSEQDLLVGDLPDRLTILHLGENLGVATALNHGISFAKDAAANFVLLMDQDSLPSTSMVEALHHSMATARSNGQKIAAIGPLLQDSQNGRMSRHVRFGWLRVGRVSCSRDQDVVCTDFLISSGSLIPMDVMDNVGAMDDTLFIDHVDTEWILRARAKGYSFLGSCKSTMSHSIGEKRLRVWFIRTREVPIHKPFRYYYIFRNSILLQKRSYPCRAWKRVDATRMAQLVIFMLLFHGQRREVLNYILRGIKDGLQERTGAMQ